MNANEIIARCKAIAEECVDDADDPEHYRDYLIGVLKSEIRNLVKQCNEARAKLATHQLTHDCYRKLPVVTHTYHPDEDPHPTPPDDDLDIDEAAAYAAREAVFADAVICEDDGEVTP